MVPEAILLRPQSLGALMAALFWVDAIRERGWAVPRLVLPNICGARQDRVNPSGDFLFTAKSVARELNARHFPSVTVLDPHSDVAPALIDRCRVVPATFAGEGYVGVIAPDGGAEKRASRIALALGVPLYHAWKSRDVTTGAISAFGVQPLSAGHYLVADDLCDAGGTFLGLAGELAKHGVTADLYVTHGLFTKGTDALLNSFRAVFCTDSTLGAKQGITVLPRCMDLLRGIV
jgi:ribose-phosphate pyrophosphokinase